jgi:FkbM family methyltransferase
MIKRLLRASVNLVPSAARGWIRHLPIVAATQRFVVNRFLSGESFVHLINSGPARGLRFEITLPQDKGFWTGTFEAEFAEAVARAVNRGDICYDIGGHRGYMTGVMALAGAKRVIIFEPLPANVAALEQLARLNPGLEFKIEAAAVGRSDGVARFKVMSDESMGKLAESTFQIDAASTRELMVPLRRLDTLLAEGKFPAPDLIKIDVEGAELEVLEGAAETLKKHHPRLFVEAHTAALAEHCTDRLTLLGYRVRQLQAGPLGPDQARHLIAARA